MVPSKLRRFKDQIRRRHDQGESVKSLAEFYKVSPAAIRYWLTPEERQALRSLKRLTRLERLSNIGPYAAAPVQTRATISDGYLRFRVHIVPHE